MQRKKVVIMGAAGRDFHNFNLYFRDNELYDVVAFTATQIPDIHGRKYPTELAGKLYPNGIKIEAESELVNLIHRYEVDLVVFSYSDVSYEYVMHKGALVNAQGANFMMMGARQTMLKSKKPVISICAVRTGSGKSQTTRRVVEILNAKGRKVVVVRHPMPYGDLNAQKVQRFASYEDLKRHHCTIEEMEEYEPHIAQGTIVYAGVDYQAILQQAEQEADVVLWDGGNNDLPFFKPDLHIVVVDPHRPGDEVSYYPGETNVVMADVIIINKIDSANYESIDQVRMSVRQLNPKAVVIEAASPISVDDISLIHNKRVLVVEDGPTLTHGEMAYGAGVIAAEKFGASELVDPRDALQGSLIAVFEHYSEIGTLLPAMGYGGQQVKDLEATINAIDCDAVVIGTPIDLRKVIHINKPATRVYYKLQEIGEPDLMRVLEKF